MSEQWRDIEGYEGYYQISNTGCVKSLSRFKQNRWGSATLIREKILHQKKTAQGYFIIGLTRDGKKLFFPVHRLVAKAFLEECAGKNTVNHIDGNKANNLLSNLEWASSKDQIHHALVNNLITPRGHSKFSPTFKKSVQSYYIEHQCSIKQLARIFQISERTAGRIVHLGVTEKTKISSDTVLQIITMRAKGLTLKAISEIVGCGISQVHRIITGKSRNINYER